MEMEGKGKDGNGLIGLNEVHHRSCFGEQNRGAGLIALKKREEREQQEG